MDDTYSGYISEEWLRDFVYQRGKDGFDGSFTSRLLLRLAEARASLAAHDASHSPDPDGCEVVSHNRETILR
jgi:hypothetical protein